MKIANKILIMIFINFIVFMVIAESISAESRFSSSSTSSLESWELRYNNAWQTLLNTTKEYDKYRRLRSTDATRIQNAKLLIKEILLYIEAYLNAYDNKLKSYGENDYLKKIDSNKKKLDELSIKIDNALTISELNSILTEIRTEWMSVRLVTKYNYLNTLHAQNLSVIDRMRKLYEMITDYVKGFTGDKQSVREKVQIQKDNFLLFEKDYMVFNEFWKTINVDNIDSNYETTVKQLRLHIESERKEKTLLQNLIDEIQQESK